MKILDPNDPFFARPLVRWLTAGLPLVWGLVEFWLDSPGWGVIFVVAGLYAGWVLIIKGPDTP